MGNTTHPLQSTSVKDLTVRWWRWRQMLNRRNGRRGRGGGEEEVVDEEREREREKEVEEEEREEGEVGSPLNTSNQFQSIT